MKLNIPHSKDLKRAEAPNCEKIVEKFLNGPIRDAILSAQNQYPARKHVNVEIPIDAYIVSGDFYKICATALEPFGYKSQQGNDYVGMYATLEVYWE